MAVVEDPLIVVYRDGHIGQLMLGTEESDRTWTSALIDGGKNAGSYSVSSSGPDGVVFRTLRLDTPLMTLARPTGNGGFQLDSVEAGACLWTVHSLSLNEIGGALIMAPTMQRGDCASEGESYRAIWRDSEEGEWSQLTLVGAVSEEDNRGSSWGAGVLMPDGSWFVVLSDSQEERIEGLTYSPESGWSDGVTLVEDRYGFSLSATKCGDGSVHAIYWVEDTEGMMHAWGTGTYGWQEERFGERTYSPANAIACRGGYLYVAYSVGSGALRLVLTRKSLEGTEWETRYGPFGTDPDLVWAGDDSRDAWRVLYELWEDSAEKSQLAISEVVFSYE